MVLWRMCEIVTMSDGLTDDCEEHNGDTDQEITEHRQGLCS